MEIIQRGSQTTALLLFLMFLTLPVFAADTGTLRGTVTDPLAAVIQGAKVELLHDGKQISSITTGQDGKFQFTSLAPGHYRVRAVAPTFASQDSPTIYVGGGNSAEVNLTLGLGTISQQIVVSSTGTEVPLSQVGASVSVISNDQFQDKLDLLEPLRQAPGAQILQGGQRGGITALFVRGGNPNANKVLLDGIPMNDIGGLVEFANIATAGVEQVEFLRGPNSVLYGSDALASVVNLTTRRGTTPLPEISYAFDGGNFNSWRHDASLAGAFHQFDYVAEFMRFDTGNSLPNNSFHNGTYLGNFGWTPNASTDVRITARHTTAAVGVPNAIELFAIPDNSFQREQDTYLGVTAQNQTTSRWHNLFRYGATRLRSQFENPSPTGIPFDPFGFGPNFLGQMVTLHGANGFTTTGQAILDFGGVYPILSSSSSKRDFAYLQSDYTLSQHLTALFGFRYENERGFTLASGQKTSTTRNNFSYTAQFQGSLGSRAFATAGAGIEDNAIFGVAVTPRVSLAYYLVRPRSSGLLNGTKLKFNYGQGIKEPSIFEESTSLFSLLSQLPGGTQLISQFHVAPIGAERSRSFDFGFEQLTWNGRTKLNVTFFYNRFTNQVEFVNNTALPQLGVPVSVAAATTFGATVNSADTRALGAETELEFNFGHGFSARAAYTYLDAVVQRSFSSDNLAPSFNPNFPAIPIGAFSPLVGNRPFRRAPHTGSFFLGYSKPKFTVSLSGYLVSRRDDSTFLSDAFFNNITTVLLPNRNLAPAYQKIDFGGSYRLNHRLSFYSSVENLANEHYDAAFGFPALPLTFRTGFKITLGGESWR
ncbi:MAG TPA: TonB-dependent receptor [Candidatus Angelobacter sp.]|nr:TonB-dependent receptor [Candidatus Angelobacter sp.]